MKYNWSHMVTHGGRVNELSGIGDKYNNNNSNNERLLSYFKYGDSIFQWRIDVSYCFSFGQNFNYFQAMSNANGKCYNDEYLHFRTCLTKN